MTARVHDSLAMFLAQWLKEEGKARNQSPRYKVSSQNNLKASQQKGPGGLGIIYIYLCFFSTWYVM